MWCFNILSWTYYKSTRRLEVYRFCAKLFITSGKIKIKVWVIIPDLHFPFHDPEYIKIVTKLITQLKPSGGIIQLGDFVDWFQLSTYDKDPERRTTARDDLESYREQMVKWSALLPAGSLYHQLCGNHEYRLARYIWGKAGAIYQMVQQIPDMLGFRDLNKISKIKFVWHPIDNYKSLKLGDTIIHHGVFFNKNIAMSNFNRYENYNFLCGHTHRVQYYSDGVRWSCSLGHGSNEKETAHIHAPMGWRQAIGVLTEINGKCSIEVIAENDGKFIFRGKPL